LINKDYSLIWKSLTKLQIWKMERIKVKAKFTYSHLRNIEKENDVGFQITNLYK